MLLDDVEATLAAASLPPDGWTLYKGILPPSPDRVVALFETGGYPPQTASDFPVVTFQVRVRGAAYGYAAARQVVEDVLAALHGAQPSGYVYVYAMQSAPALLGYDTQDNRPELAINFRAMRDQL